MTEVRAEIDRLDAALVDMIAERFGYVERAWQLKLQARQEANVPWRNQQVFDRVRTRAAEKGLPPDLIEALWRQMVGWFIQHEEEKLRDQIEGGSRGDGCEPPGQRARVRRHMTLPPHIDLTAVLMTALLNPAVIVVAFWMGRYADQRHKIPVAAFAAALGVRRRLHGSAVGDDGHWQSDAPRRVCSSPSSWQRWCGRISVIVCFRNDKRAVPAAHLALGHGCRAGGAAGVGVRAGAGVPCPADAGDRAAVGADDRPRTQPAEDAGNRESRRGIRRQPCGEQPVFAFPSPGFHLYLMRVVPAACSRGILCPPRLARLPLEGRSHGTAGGPRKGDTVRTRALGAR